MKYTLVFLLALGMISIGCTSDNKAATPNNSSAQPASNPNSSTTSANANPDQDFVNKARKVIVRKFNWVSLSRARRKIPA